VPYPARLIPNGYHSFDWRAAVSATTPKTKIRRMKTTQKYHSNFPYGHPFFCNIVKLKRFLPSVKSLGADSYFDGYL
jgi:hypothetical protein